MKYQVQLFKMSETGYYRLGIPVSFLHKFDSLDLDGVTFSVASEDLRDVWGFELRVLPVEYVSRYIGENEINAKKIAVEAQRLVNLIVANYFEEEEEEVLTEFSEPLYTTVPF